MSSRATLQSWVDQRAADNVRRALPPQAYTDNGILALECEHILKCGWIMVGHISQLQVPGDYLTHEIVDHPVLVVRGRDEHLRAFSNVCPHRSSVIAQGCGNRTVFRCPYHAWTYDMSGKLVGAPHMDKTALAGIRLKDLKVEVWQGLVFVNLDDEANPLAPDLAALEPRIAPLGLADQSVIHIEDLELACNWKILVENFCESYHVFAVHKDTLEAPTPTASTENREGGAGFNHHIQRNSTPLPPGLEAKLDLPQDKADEFHLICIYPALTFGFSPGHGLCLTVLPDGPGRLKVRIWVTRPPFDGDTAEAAETAIKRVREFLAEDMGIIEGIQRGLTAGTGNRAPLHPWEAPGWEFSQYLMRKLDVTPA